MKPTWHALRALLLVLFCSTDHVRSQSATFFDDFDGGRSLLPSVSGGFSGFTNTEPSQGFSGLGNLGNMVSGNFLHNPTGDNFTSTPIQKTTLSLSELPPHTGIQLKFLLAIIDTWDGGPQPGAFNDVFRVDVDGVARFAETFTNFDFSSQSYVAPPGVLIQRGPDLGFEIFGDGLYDMGRDLTSFGFIPHAGSTLEIDFYADGSGWNRPANESWAIDNVLVALWVIPEPATPTMLGLVLIATVSRSACRMRRRGHRC
jgi:hypothetical protein